MSSASAPQAHSATDRLVPGTAQGVVVPEGVAVVDGWYRRSSRSGGSGSPSTRPEGTRRSSRSSVVHAVCPTPLAAVLLTSILAAKPSSQKRCRTGSNPRSKELCKSDQLIVLYLYIHCWHRYRAYLPTSTGARTATWTEVRMMERRACSGVCICIRMHQACIEKVGRFEIQILASVPCPHQGSPGRREAALLASWTQRLSGRNGGGAW